MEIEVVKSKDKYSFSLCFDKEFKTEYFLFHKNDNMVQDLADIRKDDENIIALNRDFGSILMDFFDFAHSDNFQEIKSAVQRLCELLKQGRGRDMYEPYMKKLFRTYNTTNNPVEKAVALLIWYQFRVKHDEMFATKNVLSKKQWKRIVSEYEVYLKKLLEPFENRISSLEDMVDIECKLNIGAVKTDSGFVNIYTWQNDMLPVCMIYLPLIESQKRHILTCRECGRQFIAKRVDTQVCSSECKRIRQREYNRKHIDKVNNDPSIISYRELRQRYFDFEKSLKANQEPRELIYSCVETRRNYEESFNDALYQYKAGHNTLRAVNNCINRYADKLDEMIAAVGMNGAVDVTG